MECASEPACCEACLVLTFDRSLRERFWAHGLTTISGLYCSPCVSVRTLLKAVAKLMNLTALVYALYAWVSNVLRKIVIAVLRQGPVPKHIAFIMDGNRRFATKQGLKRIYGHQQGYLKVSCCAMQLQTHVLQCMTILNSCLVPTAARCSSVELGLGGEGHHSVCFQHRQLPARSRGGGGFDDTCRTKAA